MRASICREAAFIRVQMRRTTHSRHARSSPLRWSNMEIWMVLLVVTFVLLLVGTVVALRLAPSFLQHIQTRSVCMRAVKRVWRGPGM